MEDGGLSKRPDSLLDWPQPSRVRVDKETTITWKNTLGMYYTISH